MNNMEQAVQQKLKRNWCWLLALGVLFVLLGMLGLGCLVSVTLASMVLIGIILVVVGAMQLIDSFTNKSWKAVIWHVLIALLYIYAGGLIIYDPIMASAIITIMLAWTLIVIGVIRCFMAFTIRGTSGWFWLFLAGIAAIVLGIMILMHWPMSGFWVMGLLISIELLINGWSYIFLAFALRKA